MRPSFYATVNLVSIDHTDTEREPKAIPSSGHQRPSGALASPGIDAFPRAAFYNKGTSIDTRGTSIVTRGTSIVTRGTSIDAQGHSMHRPAVQGAYTGLVIDTFQVYKGGACF